MKFLLNETPVSKARPRIFKRGGKYVAYDPQGESKIKTKCDLKRQMRENGIYSASAGLLHVDMIVHTAMPLSWPVSRCIAFEGCYCDKRPDLDNYLKYYLDALNGVAYADDKQVVSLYAEKRYSVTPCVEITITQKEESMINEHALTIKGEITSEELDYMIKKANRLGLNGRKIARVYSQEDNEGKHIYFEAEGLKQCTG